MVGLHGTSGRCVGVWRFADAPDAVSQVILTPQSTALATVTTADGTTATHEPAPHGWHIGLTARHSRSSIDLEVLAADDPRITPPPATPSVVTQPQQRLSLPLLTHADDVASHGIAFALGEAAYVQTEEPWGENNTPTAQLFLGRTADELVVRVEARTGHAPVVPEEGSETHMPANPLDNERADTNADGVQCYLGVAGDPRGRWRAGVLAVPLEGGRARVTSLVPGGAVPDVHTESRTDGWQMVMRWPLSALPHGPLTFDLVVNERPPHRERRRGQLVLSGGGGFGYLRGDRHDPVTPFGLLVP
jgi:hypothetical protein